MRGYQIYIKTERGYKYFGKTPIAEQAYSIKYQLEEKGYSVLVRNLATFNEV